MALLARRSLRTWPDPPQYRVVHGHRRAIRVLGQGPVLLLIHGIGDSSATWSRVAPALARDFTVVAPDLLGHGESDKPRADYGVAPYACAMRDLLSVLDIDRASVIGHSLGGGVAMQFAYQFPERCERLMLVGAGGAGPQVHPLLRLLASPVGEPVLRLATSSTSRFAVRAVAAAGSRLEDLRRQAASGWLDGSGWLSGLGRLPGPGWLGVLGWPNGRGWLDGVGLSGPGRADLQRALDVHDALAEEVARQAYLRTLRSVVDGRGQVVTMLDRSYLTEGMPTWLVWGGRDRVIPVDHAARAQAAMPGSRLHVFPDAGHFPHEDHPAEFVELVREFAAVPPAPFDVQRWRDLLRRGQGGAGGEAGRPGATSPPAPPAEVPAAV